MDSTQIEHERAVGDRLVDWLNRRDGTRFSFSHRENEAPDLAYADAGDLLRVEVVGAYYDAADAKRQWQAARQIPDAPTRWRGTNFDRRLLRDVEAQVRKKCKLSYGPNCVLVVTVRPSLTSELEMEELLHDLTLPNQVPFVGIYLTGDFPVTSKSPGGFRVWALYLPAS